jgi:hypothetical protein
MEKKKKEEKKPKKKSYEDEPVKAKSYANMNRTLRGTRK